MGRSDTRATAEWGIAVGTEIPWAEAAAERHRCQDSSAPWWRKCWANSSANGCKGVQKGANTYKHGKKHSIPSWSFLKSSNYLKSVSNVFCVYVCPSWQMQQVWDACVKNWSCLLILLRISSEVVHKPNPAKAPLSDAKIFRSQGYIWAELHQLSNEWNLEFWFVDMLNHVEWSWKKLNGVEWLSIDRVPFSAPRRTPSTGAFAAAAKLRCALLRNAIGALGMLPGATVPRSLGEILIELSNWQSSFRAGSNSNVVTVVPK